MSSRPAVPITFAAHAVKRFRERVRPALSLEGAERELNAMAPTGRLTDKPPEFLRDRRRDAPAYLEIACAVFPIAMPGAGLRLTATTCLTPDSRRHRRFPKAAGQSRLDTPRGAAPDAQ